MAISAQRRSSTPLMPSVMAKRMNRSVAATLTIRLKSSAARRRRNTIGENAADGLPFTGRSGALGAAEEARRDRKKPIRLQFEHLLRHRQRRMRQPGTSQDVAHELCARGNIGLVGHLRCPPLIEPSFRKSLVEPGQMRIHLDELAID